MHNSILSIFALWWFIPKLNYVSFLLSLAHFYFQLYNMMGVAFLTETCISYKFVWKCTLSVQLMKLYVKTIIIFKDMNGDLVCAVQEKYSDILKFYILFSIFWHLCIGLHVVLWNILLQIYVVAVVEKSCL